MVTHPGRRQVGNDAVAGAQLVHFCGALCSANKAGVRLAYALGFAGGARGVQDDGHILFLDGLHHAFPGAGVVTVPFLSQLLELFHTDQTGFRVLAQATGVVVDDVLNAGHGFAHFQQLVYLFLVFCESKRNFCVLHHKAHLLCHRILVQRNRDSADALHRHEAHVQVGPVIADKGQVLAFCQSQRRQATGYLTHVLGHIGPCPCLPDAVFLLAQSRSARPFGSMLEQQVRKCFCHRRSSKFHATKSQMNLCTKAQQVHELKAS